MVALFAGQTGKSSNLGDGRALLVRDELADRWIKGRSPGQRTLTPFEFGQHLRSTSCGPSQALCPVSDGISPETKSEALAFAQALRATRAIDKESPLQDALYVEKVSRLLPTYSISSRTDDDVILGYWLTGGANVSVNAFRRLRQMLSWMGASNLKEVVEAAGSEVAELIPAERRRAPVTQQEASRDTLSEGRRQVRVGKRKHVSSYLADRNSSIL